MAKIAIEFEDRKVYWEVPDPVAVNMLQSFVQVLGPAQEDEGPTQVSSVYDAMKVSGVQMEEDKVHDHTCSDECAASEDHMRAMEEDAHRQVKEAEND